MEQLHAAAVAAGFAASAALSWIAFELRAQRLDRRALEAERQAFEAARVNRDTTNAHALLEAMRLADAAERERRARDREHRAAVEALVTAVRTLLGQHDEVARELIDEIRRLTRAIVEPVGPSRPPPPPRASRGEEIIGERRPAIPPPPPLPLDASSPPEEPR